MPATDDMEEHLKSSILDTEQTIRLSALTTSGTLAGSAPVNIPKKGSHQSSQFSPHSPCGVLGIASHPANEKATAGLGIDSFSFNNQVLPLCT